MDQPARHSGTDGSTVRVSVPFVAGATGTELVDGELVFDPADPYAVSMRLVTRSGPVVWTFARELLSEGSFDPVGTGDVRVWPCLGAAGEAVVVIELVSPRGTAFLQASSRAVREFLDRAAEVVPVGQETAHLHLDVVVDRLLSGR